MAIMAFIIAIFAFMMAIMVSIVVIFEIIIAIMISKLGTIKPKPALIAPILPFFNTMMAKCFYFNFIFRCLSLAH
jgi:hypothetical protein